MSLCLWISGGENAAARFPKAPRHPHRYPYLFSYTESEMEVHFQRAAAHRPRHSEERRTSDLCLSSGASLEMPDRDHRFFASLRMTVWALALPGIRLKRCG